MKRKTEKEMGALRCSRRIAEKDGDDEGRNGFVNSVLNPMFGRGGVAGDATTTSWQGCGESTSRQLRRKLAIGPRAVRRRLEKKIRSPKVRRQRLKGFESIEWFCKQRGEAGQEGESGPARRESGLEEDWGVDMDIEGRRSSRMVKTRGSWMSKERGCRRNCETLRSSRSYRRKLIQSGLKAGLQQQLQDIEQKRHDLLREHQRVQKTSQQHQKEKQQG